MGDCLAGDLLVAMTAAPEGVVLPVGGVIVELIPSAQVSLGENLSTCWTGDGGAIGVIPSLEASSFETSLGKPAWSIREEA